MSKKTLNKNEWTHRAFMAVQQVLREHEGETFLAEDLRYKAEERLKERPKDPRNWGAVMRMAAKEKLIRRQGYAPARSSNQSPKVLWARVDSGSRVN